MEKKVNIPKKWAAKKWAKRLKELSQQKPPKDLMEVLNQTEEEKKSAEPDKPKKDLSI